MEELCSLPRTTESDSARRKRFKIMMTLLILGILVISLIGTCGYFAYKGIMSQEAVSNTNGQSMQRCAPSPKTSTVLLKSTTTKMPISSSIHTTRRPLKTTSSSSIGTSKVPTVYTQTHDLQSSLRETAIESSMLQGQTSTVSYKQPTASLTRSSFTNPSVETTSTPSSSAEETKQSTKQISTSYFATNTAQSSSVITTTTENPPAISEIHSDPCKNFTPDMCNNGTETVSYFCECVDNDIWTIIQKRFDGSVDFYRNWTEHKDGFGDTNGEYWLGNDAIYQMTSTANCTLKVYVTGWDNVTKYAIYETFRIADEAGGYRLTIGGYSGSAGDSLSFHHAGQMFSTKDVDNDALASFDTAEYFSTAWWFGSQLASSLNGRYLLESNSDEYGIVWSGYGKGPFYSMKETKMLIKPINYM